jgi:hypothetical protein
VVEREGKGCCQPDTTSHFMLHTSSRPNNDVALKPLILPGFRGGEFKTGGTGCNWGDHLSRPIHRPRLFFSSSPKNLPHR